MKIVAWSFVPTLIILVAVAMVTFTAYQRVTEDLVLGRNQELTRLAAGQLGNDLTQYTSLLTGVARAADIYRGDPDTQRAALAKARNQLVVFDAGVVLINRYGRVVGAEPERPDIIDQNWADRSYYRQMLRTASAVFSDVVPDGPRGSDVVVVAVPITGEQNEFQGTLAGMFRLGATAVSAFYGDIVKLRIGEGGTTYLVDSTGRVVYHSDAALIDTDASKNWAVSQMLSKKTFQLSARDLDNGKVVSSIAPVTGTSWALVTEETWYSLLSSSQAYRQFLLVLLALGVVVPVVVVTLGVRRITGPIAELIAASKEVASGKFGNTISVHTGDELEELANQFNIMSAELQESYADLEKKVEERTKELAALAEENARLYGQAHQLAVIEERNRLARDLHDSVTQAVYSVTLYAEAATRLLNGGQVEMAAEHLRDLRNTAQQALREMRSLIFELRPPVLEKEGLVAALQARLEAVEGRAGVATEFKMEGSAALPVDLESGLYRIALEALNNALKHSQARSVKLYLRRDEDLVILEVSDDGTGFDLEAGRGSGGLGLTGMEERAVGLGGKLEVRSASGEGTTVRVEVKR